MALKNRTESKAIVTNWTPVLDLETTHKPDLRDNILDNIIFRKDVAGSGTGTGSITIDFLDIDYISWDGSGSNLTITLSNIQQGEIKYLMLTKTIAASVAFVSPVIFENDNQEYVKSLRDILFKIYNKNGTDIHVRMITNDVPESSTLYPGVIEKGIQAEVDAGIDNDRAIVPSTLFNCDFLMKTKIIAINNWNMTSGSGSLTFTQAHGLTKSKIRYCKAVIYGDDGGDVYMLEFNGSGHVKFDTTYCTLINNSGSWFDSSNYDNGSILRGYLIIEYEA